ncbi:Uncharacterised protein [Streptococcus pneumoniae]|nr:Uncharacterised protein [Streptococcus pneumoniae]
MSNLEEFAQAVGRDVKRFETDYTSKAELEAKDYIEGKSDYQILKHQVESLVKQTQTLQEQLALVKPALRRAPMAYTIDLNSTPPIALNPIKSADDYDWTNARLSEQGNVASWRWGNQKNLIRIMYQFGIWDAKTVESLGAVRR